MSRSLKEVNMGWVEVDARVIDDYCEKNNVSRGEISLGIGRDVSFLSHVIKRGTIKENDYICIKAMFGIDIKKTPIVPAPPQNEESSLSEISVNELKTIIYEAVYHAVKDAWEDDKEDKSFAATEKGKSNLGMD